MNSRPLIAYIPWHARDVGVKVFAPLLLFGVIAGLPLSVIPQQTGVSLLNLDAQMQDFALKAWSSTAGLCVTIGSILLMSGSIALDREKQHVRFLFAHQIAPTMFYLQRFAVATALFATTFLLAPLAYSVVVPVPVLGTLLAVLLSSFFIGSMTMLFGAITQRDGAFFIVVFLLGNVLQGFTAQGVGPKWMQIISWILPPVRQVGEFSGAWLNGRTVEPQDLVLVLGYGIGMLLSALYLIKRAPLVR